MRDNDYPAEVSDPEASGLPGTADDDSTAYDSVDSGRWADGPDPAALPGTGPGGANRYGTTPGEAREGQTLDQRLRQEIPDVGAPREVLPTRADPVDETVDSSEQRDFDADVWGASPTSDPDSPVSLYDDGQLDENPQPVGRLVAPDEGSGVDQEPDSVAYDAGAAGGGASAEELAVHETRAPDYN